LFLLLLYSFIILSLTLYISFIFSFILTLISFMFMSSIKEFKRYASDPNISFALLSIINTHIVKFIIIARINKILNIILIFLLLDFFKIFFSSLLILNLLDYCLLCLKYSSKISAIYLTDAFASSEEVPLLPTSINI